jgi:hypothetical protein
MFSSLLFTSDFSEDRKIGICRVQNLQQRDGRLVIYANSEYIVNIQPVLIYRHFDLYSLQNLSANDLVIYSVKWLGDTPIPCFVSYVAIFLVTYSPNQLTSYIFRQLAIWSIS